METRISQLKTEFAEISDIRKQVKNFFEILQVRINKLKQFYSDFVKNNQSDLFVFGLDSLHFQSKLIDIEYDDMKRIFLAINNRMYCEYFKLYKIIVNYVNENNFDKKILELIKGNNFPIYKDLEPYKEYDIELIYEIHESLILMLNAILGYLEGKQHELQFHIMKKNIGLNIDNFISSFSYDLTMIKEKINLFVAYLEFFHKLHVKQLQRFSNKIQLLYQHVNKDINFDEAIDINDDKNSEKSKESILSIKKTKNENFSSDTDGTDAGINYIIRKNSMSLKKVIEIDQVAASIDNLCNQVMSPENKKEEENPPGITIDMFQEEEEKINDREKQTKPEEFSAPFNP
jgi:hypothetical protein